MFTQKNPKFKLFTTTYKLIILFFNNFFTKLFIFCIYHFSIICIFFFNQIRMFSFFMILHKDFIKKLTIFI